MPNSVITINNNKSNNHNNNNFELFESVSTTPKRVCTSKTLIQRRRIEARRVDYNLRINKSHIDNNNNNNDKANMFKLFYRSKEIIMSISMSYVFVVSLLILSIQLNQVSSTSQTSDFIAISQSFNGDQIGSQQHSMALSNFDATLYKNVHEAIRNHPDLREVSYLL